MISPKQIQVGEFTFDYRESGEENEELVILLHGFPETSIMWTKLMDHFASQGFHCIAPDMRGYSAGACPKGAKHYTMDKLRQDIVDLADAVGKPKFHLVGHDWGAAVGWSVVYHFAERIISWSALSIPHSKAFAKAYKTDPIQKKKSRYIGWFLLPFIPEIMIRSNDFSRFRRLWKRSSDEEVAHYLSVFRRKASLTGALNYYRANLSGKNRDRIGEIHTPTLFIWGNRDLAVGEVAAKGTEKYMTGPYSFVELDAGHWLIQSSYDQVELHLTDHLSKNRKK